MLLSERMVRTTKRCLRKMVGRAHFTRDEQHNAVVEIEAVINSRPLSYVSATDLEEPLTHSLSSYRWQEIAEFT